MFNIKRVFFCAPTSHTLKKFTFKKTVCQRALLCKRCIDMASASGFKGYFARSGYITAGVSKADHIILYNADSADFAVNLLLQRESNEHEKA